MKTITCSNARGASALGELVDQFPAGLSVQDNKVYGPALNLIAEFQTTHQACAFADAVAELLESDIYEDLTNGC